MSAAVSSTTSKSFKMILANCDEVVKTHGPNKPVGSRKYLARDFSIVAEAGKMGKITELLFEFQSKLHALKPKNESALAEASPVIKQMTTQLHLLSEFGLQQKLFKFRIVFERLIFQTAYHALVPQRFDKVLGELKINFFQVYTPFLSLLIIFKEFSHICARFSKATTDCEASMNSSSALTHIVFSSKASESGENESSITLSTMPGMSFLIRWFRKVEGSNKVIPKKNLSDKEFEAFKPFLKNTSLEVQKLAKRFLFCSSELIKMSKFPQHLEMLRKSFETISVHKEVIKNTPILEPYFKLIQFVYKELPLLKNKDHKELFNFGKKLSNLITSEIAPHEATLNANYKYMYKDLFWYISRKKSKLEPKRMYPSLLDLNNQDDIFSPELFEKISVLITKDMVIGSIDPLVAVINEAIELSSTSLDAGKKEADEKDAKHKSSSQIGAATASRATAAAMDPVKSAAARIGAAESAAAPVRNFKEVAATEILAALANPTADSKIAKETDALDQVKMKSEFKKGINYPSNVRQWFTHPQEAIKNPKYSSLSQKIQSKIKRLHTFPLCVDQFVGGDYCRKKVIKNEKGVVLETQYRLPAEVIMDGKITFALVEYTMDATNCCFHRCISEQETDTFVNTWMNFDFPTLYASVQAADNATEVVADDGEVNITFEPGLENFVIENEHITIRLIKVGEE